MVLPSTTDTPAVSKKTLPPYIESGLSKVFTVQLLGCEAGPIIFNSLAISGGGGMDSGGGRTGVDSGGFITRGLGVCTAGGIMSGILSAAKALTSFRNGCKKKVSPTPILEYKDLMLFELNQGQLKQLFLTSPFELDSPYTHCSYLPEIIEGINYI